MKKQIYIVACLLLIIAAINFSCSDKEEAIGIEIFFVAPENEDKIQIGGEFGAHMEGEIIVTGSFLKEYTLSVFPTENVKETKDSTVYVFSKTYYPSFEKIREENMHNHDIKPPTEIDGKPVRTGWYFLKLEAKDKNGNSDSVLKQIYLTYEDQGHHH